MSKIFLDCFETPESTRPVCAAGKRSHNWTKGQNKGREALSLSVLKLPGLGRSKIIGRQDAKGKATFWLCLLSFLEARDDPRPAPRFSLVAQNNLGLPVTFQQIRRLVQRRTMNRICSAKFSGPLGIR